jgi:polyferredoxin
MVLFYRALADVVVVAHASYVAFVLFGQLLILVGMLRHWRWIRNLPFRLVHLVAIVVVVLESWCGITCPLTTWERWSREAAGDVTYEGDFIANAVHAVLFYRASPWVFTVCYTVFGVIVLLSFVLAPPHRKPRLDQVKTVERDRT